MSDQIIEKIRQSIKGLAIELKKRADFEYLLGQSRQVDEIKERLKLSDDESIRFLKLKHTSPLIDIETFHKETIERRRRHHKPELVKEHSDVLIEAKKKIDDLSRIEYKTNLSDVKLEGPEKLSPEESDQQRNFSENVLMAAEEADKKADELRIILKGLEGFEQSVQKTGEIESESESQKAREVKELIEKLKAAKVKGNSTELNRLIDYYNQDFLPKHPELKIKVKVGETFDERNIQPIVPFGRSEGGTALRTTRKWRLSSRKRNGRGRKSRCRRRR